MNSDLLSISSSKSGRGRKPATDPKDGHVLTAEEKKKKKNEKQKENIKKLVDKDPDYYKKQYQKAKKAKTCIVHIVDPVEKSGLYCFKCKKLIKQTDPKVRWNMIKNKPIDDPQFTTLLDYIVSKIGEHEEFEIVQKAYMNFCENYIKAINTPKLTVNIPAPQPIPVQEIKKVEPVEPKKVEPVEPQPEPEDKEDSDDKEEQDEDDE